MTALTIESLSVALPPGADRPLAVTDLSLAVAPGETLCIIGPSGSGKSVLAAAMMAALPAGLRIVGGDVRLGQPSITAMAEKALQPLRGNRIALVPQNPIAALNPLVPVGDQIGEVFAIHSDLAPAERRARVSTLLDDVGLGGIVGIAARYPHQLSGGQCQRVAIAMAIAMAPDVLIADEPTTALDSVAAAQILQLLARLQASSGHALVFISHDLAIVGGIADRIIVLDGGRLIESGTAHAILAHPGQPETAALVAASRPPSARPPRRVGAMLLEVDGLAKAYDGVIAVDDVGFSLHAGETLAILGQSGSGKSTLARMIVQLIAPDAGAVRVDGVDLLHLRGAAARRSRSLVQMVFQDPFGSLNPHHRVGDAIARAAVRSGARRSEARARAIDLLRRVGLPAAAFGRLPTAFSGGQRQRIGIARALAAQPKVLICDESVTGLDPVSQTEVLALLAEIQAETGLAIVFITHDLRAAAAIADRIMVMEAGRIVETGTTDTVLASPRAEATRALVAAVTG